MYIKTLTSLTALSPYFVRRPHPVCLLFSFLLFPLAIPVTHVLSLNYLVFKYGIAFVWITNFKSHYSDEMVISLVTFSVCHYHL